MNKEQIHKEFDEKFNGWQAIAGGELEKHHKQIKSFYDSKVQQILEELGKSVKDYGEINMTDMIGLGEAKIVLKDKIKELVYV